MSDFVARDTALQELEAIGDAALRGEGFDWTS
jgi:hypothetical protein